MDPKRVIKIVTVRLGVCIHQEQMRSVAVIIAWIAVKTQINVGAAQTEVILEVNRSMLFFRLVVWQIRSPFSGASAAGRGNVGVAIEGGGAAGERVNTSFCIIAPDGDVATRHEGIKDRSIIGGCNRP
jgi:hypothetical protein